MIEWFLEGFFLFFKDFLFDSTVEPSSRVIPLSRTTIDWHGVTRLFTPMHHGLDQTKIWYFTPCNSVSTPEGWNTIHIPRVQSQFKTCEKLSSDVIIMGAIFSALCCSRDNEFVELCACGKMLIPPSIFDMNNERMDSWETQASLR